MPSRSWIVILVAAACARELPSTTPLGSGPLADVETDAAPAKAVQDAGPDVVDATPPAQDQSAPQPSDAGGEAAADAAMADAAPADAAAPDATPALLAVAGDYRGEDVTITEVAPFPKATERDPKARIDVTQPSPEQVVFTIIDSNNGQTLCSFKAKLSGSSASFEPGQSCSAFGPVTRIERGSGTFSGDNLKLEVHGTIEAVTPQQTFKGTFDYSFTGKRR